MGDTTIGSCLRPPDETAPSSLGLICLPQRWWESGRALGGNYRVAMLIDKLPGPTGLGDVYLILPPVARSIFCHEWQQ